LRHRRLTHASSPGHQPVSNDERRGHARDFQAAFRIAGRAGLLLSPHGVAGPTEVPLRRLLDDGVPLALAADDPLLFRMSVRGSASRPGAG